MSNQVLQMKYHPAKKEVVFRRFESGSEKPIRNESRLKTYMNKKGKFVLQDFGKEFFDDIVYSFSGAKEIAMEVITTKGDFDDFMSMLEYYNEGSKVKITAKLIAELPDMQKTYEAVKNHGLESMEILKKHRGEFFNVSLTTEEVKECVESFAKEVLEAANDIEDKINRLEQNTVNICFSGVYSAGKSMLINSILGYSVLPENIMPETAAMFRIKSPEEGGNIRTVFDIKTDHSEIVWNEKESIFEFVSGPAESDCRKRIQDVIYDNRELPCYSQLRCILDVLNKEMDVLRNIDVYFPIPLDSDRLQFTIFDTPGTDSDDDEHQRILQDALSEQTHSILVFVVSPNNLKGGGNKTLLRYLSDAEKKESKSTIDLGRSLFVINMADMLTGDAQFIKLKQADIEEDGLDPIKLSDKKLFFTSAKFGYAARAVKNGVATEQEEFTIATQSGAVTNEKFGRYYRFDQCATSEFATNKLLDTCTEAFDAAMADNNTSEAVWVASGLYALQNEIILYGIKYASAVKAYSIIDGVDKALARLEKNASSLKQQNDEDIERVEQEIRTITDAVTKSINDAYKSKKLPKDRTLPASVLSTLELDVESLGTFCEEGKSRLKKVVSGLFGIFNKKWDEKDQKKVNTVITNVVDDYTDRFKGKRKKLLESVRDEFIAEIKKAIEENGGLSDAAKDYISSIVPPEIEDFESTFKFDQLYDRSRKTVGFWIFEHDVIDKEKFLEKAGTELRQIAEDLFEDYKTKYGNSLESLLTKVKAEFTSNMEKYNKMLRAKTKDKESMEALKEKIEAAAKELKGCQERLNGVIWREE